MQCPSPITIKVGNGYESVPCGKCEFCLDRKRTEWSYRLSKELNFADSAHFLTMTYEDSNLMLKNLKDGRVDRLENVINKERKFNDYWLPTLNKRDVQLFLKRLREKQRLLKLKSWESIRYYLVGEYGSKTYRPHYHAIMFNLFPDLVNYLADIWEKGHVHAGDVNPASIHYVTKYFMQKGKYNPSLEKPFTLMSRKPGIGYKYAQKIGFFHKETLQPYVVNNGHKQAIPRYYKDMFFNMKERDIIRGKLIEESDKKNIEYDAKYEHKGKNPYAVRISQIESKREKLSKVQTKKSSL